MPAPRIPAVGASNACRTRRQKFDAKVDGILVRRDRLIGEVRLLRDGGNASRLVDNAQQMLTRWWSRANWSAREELLKTADWLIRIEKRRADGCG